MTQAIMLFNATCPEWFGTIIIEGTDTTGKYILSQIMPTGKRHRLKEDITEQEANIYAEALGMGLMSCRSHYVTIGKLNKDERG